MTEFSNNELEVFDENFLYQIAQKVVSTAKKIVLSSGITLLLMASPTYVSAMNNMHNNTIKEVIIPSECLLKLPSNSIIYNEPAPGTIIMTSLQSHKGNLMPDDVKTAFSRVAENLGMLRCSDIICRWSTVHKTVSTIQKLENGLELRSTWFAERESNEVVFTILHYNEEIITSRSDVSYLVEHVRNMVEKSETYVHDTIS